MRLSLTPAGWRASIGDSLAIVSRNRDGPRTELSGGVER